MTIRLDTVGDLIEQGYTIEASCNCGRWAWLDLQAIADKHGRDLPYRGTSITSRLTCSACGAKGSGALSIRLHPPTGYEAKG